MLCCTCITGLLLIYMFMDLNYFLRFGCLLVCDLLFGKKKKVLDPSVSYGLCTTHDVDILYRHMNNARYFREADFARFKYLFRSGLYKAALKYGGNAVQAAATTRYRRAISLFTLFKVESRVIYWEGQSIYMEQRFIGLTDGFVYTVMICKQTFAGLKISVDELLQKMEPGIRNPTPPKELTLWLELMEESSKSLKKEK